jgi:hypothetical protein
MDDKKEPPPKEVSRATSAAKAATDQVERALGEAEEAVQRAAGRAWSQAGDMADDVSAAGRRAQAGSHQIKAAAHGGDWSLRSWLCRGFFTPRAPVTADNVGDPKWREALKARRDPLCTHRSHCLAGFLSSFSGPLPYRKPDRSMGHRILRLQSNSTTNADVDLSPSHKVSGFQ